MESEIERRTLWLQHLWLNGSEEGGYMNLMNYLWGVMDAAEGELLDEASLLVSVAIRKRDSQYKDVELENLEVA